MTSPQHKAELLRNLHVAGQPLVLFNIWDAGSAAAVARAGAKAVATGSWSVAAAQGSEDEEQLPLEDAFRTISKITRSVELPVTIDFEGGYGADPETVGQNVRRVIQLGVVGLNFEDQVVRGSGLYSIQDQAKRIRAVRDAADCEGIRIFINARTDVFFKAGADANHADLVQAALTRASAYADAGADGFFVPGLSDTALIRDICDTAPLPINIMMKPDQNKIRDAAQLGVSRISFGPFPFKKMIFELEQDAKHFY